MKQFITALIFGFCGGQFDFFVAITYVIWPLSVLGLILMSVSFKVLFVIYLSCYCGIILESLGK